VEVDSERRRPCTLIPAASTKGAVSAMATPEIEALFRRLEPRLGRFLAQLVRDRQLAEDLLQDTFHDALRGGSGLGEAVNPEAWLFGMARNRALGALRRRRRLDAALHRLMMRRYQEQEEAELVALRDLLERTLAAEDRALVLLRYLHDFDAIELAEMTGLSVQAVRQRLSRARKRLLAAAAADPERATKETR
jgi:RNA polymerase sigma-70 factor, ECF subfamily